MVGGVAACRAFSAALVCASDRPSLAYSALAPASIAWLLGVTMYPSQVRPPMLLGPSEVTRPPCWLRSDSDAAGEPVVRVRGPDCAKGTSSQCRPPAAAATRLRPSERICR